VGPESIVALTVIPVVIFAAIPIITLILFLFAVFTKYFKGGGEVKEDKMGRVRSMHGEMKHVYILVEKRKW
jgi:hypothetical protein